MLFVLVLQALSFDLGKILAIFEGQKSTKVKIQDLENYENGSFSDSSNSKLISRKTFEAEKIL